MNQEARELLNLIEAVVLDSTAIPQKYHLDRINALRQKWREREAEQEADDLQS